MPLRPATWNTQYIPPILRLHAEIGGMFVDRMDMESLIKWRLTCKTNYLQATGALRRNLLALLRQFVPFPNTLVDTVGAYHALFGGELALCFILRDPTYIPNSLEIYSSEYEFDKLCETVLNDPNIQDHITDQQHKLHPFFFCLRRLIGKTLTIDLANGRSIHIHRSYTISAAAPLTRTPCTALSNFVTPYGFGCSHPILTLNRRALLADQELRYLPEIDAATLNNILKHRFSMAVSPAAWPEYRRTIVPPSTTDSPDAPDVNSTTASSRIGSPTSLVMRAGDSFSVGDTAEEPPYDDTIPDGIAEVPVDILEHSDFYVTQRSDGDRLSIHDLEQEDDSNSFTNHVDPDVSGDQALNHLSLTTVAHGITPPPAQDHGYLERGATSHITTDTAPQIHHHASTQQTIAQLSNYPDDDTIKHTLQSSTGHADDASVTDVRHDAYDQGHGYLVEYSDLIGDDGSTYSLKAGWFEAAIATDLALDHRQVAAHNQATTVPSNPLQTEPLQSVPHTLEDMLEDEPSTTDDPATTSDHPTLSVDHATTVNPSQLQIVLDGHNPPSFTLDIGDTDIDSTDTESIGFILQTHAYRDPALECWRDIFICPSQGRYFGDPGSFVDFFDPLRGDESNCVNNNIAPYGPMVVWRVMSTFDCDEGCEYFDDVLEEGVTSIPVMFKKDPYGKLRDIVSDRYMSQFGRNMGPRRRRSRSI